MKDVLWLNKETLKERWLHPYFCFINPNIWVKVPDGATFATGDKDSLVFRKDGRYYEDGEWIKTELTFDKVGNYSQLKLFWVKSDIKGSILSNNFTVAWAQVFGEKFVDSVYKAVKQNKDNTMKKDNFTLERLLGCEVKILGEVGHIDESVLEVVNYFSDKYDLPAATPLRNLTFFTEDGNELTFDEYVNMYYGEHYDFN